MAEFMVRPEQLNRVTTYMNSVSSSIIQVHRMVANVADGLSGIGLGDVRPNILAIENSLNKHKGNVISLSEAMGRIKTRFTSADTSVFFNAMAEDIMSQPGEAGAFNSDLMFYGGNASGIDGNITRGGAGDLTGESGDSGNSITLPYEIDYENSNTSDNYYALAHQIPLSQWQTDNLPEGCHAVVEGGQVVAIRIDKVFGDYTVTITGNSVSVDGCLYQNDDPNNQTTIGEVDAQFDENGGWIEGTGAEYQHTDPNTGYGAGFDIGSVNAGSYFDFGLLDDQGHFSPHFNISLGAEASVADANVSTNQSVLGIDTTTQVSVGVGAGSYIHLSYEDGVFEYTADLGDLLDVGLSGSADVNGFDPNGPTDFESPIYSVHHSMVPNTSGNHKIPVKPPVDNVQ